MKRTVCLVIIFLLAQVLSSLVVLFFFNLSDLLHEGRLDVNALATSPSALGISLLLNGAVVWAVMTLLRWTDRKSFRFGPNKMACIRRRGLMDVARHIYCELVAGDFDIRGLE